MVMITNSQHIATYGQYSACIIEENQQPAIHIHDSELQSVYRIELDKDKLVNSDGYIDEVTLLVESKIEELQKEDEEKEQK